MPLHDAVHIDAGQVDRVGVKRPQRHDFLDLDHANLATGRGGRVEVAGGLAEHAVAGRVGLPRLDDGEVRDDPAFQDIGFAVEILMLLAVGDHRAHAGAGEKAGDARAARPHPFGKRALGVELQLQFARQVLPHEFGVFANIGRDHLFDLPRRKQHTKAKAVNARVVRRNRQIAGPRIADRRDQQFRDAAQSKAAAGNQHAVEQQPVQRSRRVGIDLCHRKPRLNSPRPYGRGARRKSIAAAQQLGPAPAVPNRPARNAGRKAALHPAFGPVSGRAGPEPTRKGS